MIEGDPHRISREKLRRILRVEGPVFAAIVVLVCMVVIVAIALFWPPTHMTKVYHLTVSPGTAQAIDITCQSSNPPHGNWTSTAPVQMNAWMGGEGQEMYYQNHGTSGSFSAPNGGVNQYIDALSLNDYANITVTEVCP